MKVQRKRKILPTSGHQKTLTFSEHLMYDQFKSCVYGEVICGIYAVKECEERQSVKDNDGTLNHAAKKITWNVYLCF